MAKNTVFNPLIFLSETPGDDVVIGGRTGQGSTDPVPCKFEAWKNSKWAGDYWVDNVIDVNDFGVWWVDNEFSMADWQDLNPDIPWNPEWES